MQGTAAHLLFFRAAARLALCVQVLNTFENQRFRTLNGRIRCTRGRLPAEGFVPRRRLFVPRKSPAFLLLLQGCLGACSVLSLVSFPCPRAASGLLQACSRAAPGLLQGCFRAASGLLCALSLCVFCVWFCAGSVCVVFALCVLLLCVFVFALCVLKLCVAICIGLCCGLHNGP